jgi:hypothetical protein
MLFMLPRYPPQVCMHTLRATRACYMDGHTVAFNLVISLIFLSHFYFVFEPRTPFLNDGYVYILYM